MKMIDITQENIIRTISLLDRNDYDFLNSPQFKQMKHLRFFLKWCVDLHISNVRFEWCIDRHHDKHGKDCKDGFEICLTETELTQPDPWKRVTFFLWNNDDFNGKKFSDKLYICQSVNYEI